MSDRLDERIRATVVELVETSPDPHPVWDVLAGRSRRPGPLSLPAGLVRMGLVAAAVLLVGLAGLWIGRALPPSGVADVPVKVGALGPEPEFPTDDLGTEVALTQISGENRPDVAPNVLDGPVVAAGRIEGTDVEVFTWVSTDPPGTRCLQVLGPALRESICSSQAGSDTEMEPRAFPRNDPETGEPTQVIAVWKVPASTSVVAVAVGEEVWWQRPRGEVAAFTFQPDTPTVIFQAWDADRESLASAGLSPQRISAPDTDPSVAIDGAPEDLAQIPESHPAVELVDQGLNDQASMAAAATDQEIPNFSCARGGGLPGWELCLIYAEGILAVVPFDGEPGLAARVRDPNLRRDVLVPLHGTEPVGIANTGLHPTVIVEYLGEYVGSTSATWSTGTNP